MTTPTYILTAPGSVVQVSAPLYVTGNGPLVAVPPLILSGPSPESIIAQITQNRKQALADICIENGYSFTPAAIEEKKLETRLDKTPLIQITRQVDLINPDANFSDEHTIAYAVFCFILAPDQNAPNGEVTHQFRNVIPDIQRAWMKDIYCGELAESTVTAALNDDIVKDEAGNRCYCAMVGFEVTARIDSKNPYLQG